MKFRLLILILFVFKIGYSQSEKLEDYKITNIKNVIELFTLVTNNNNIYRVYRNIIGKDDSPDITLEVEKNGKIILTEDGTMITE